MDFRKLVRSFRYAFYGMYTALSEQNMRIHIISAVIAIAAGFFTGLSNSEWLVLILLIAIVISTEMVNTAIETVVNLVSPDFHPLAKKAKDVAAGAVLVFAIASVIIGLLIFIPKWF
ncbi:undecaprenol kinase [Ureibacillus xyleni]|uniref:Undecaprenol kinase n=1 Tax=Ureibacillus xyleni TaxID=614648 RepID=A0A285TFF7_9BACL|nr:diacylglycerol kinase family protein [Ureibacillus xyleni]SOC20869.1 undecaprenol kinase [Ureibacillus xyleni]